VGTTSIEKSELLGKLLLRAGIEHEVLNAKQHEKEAMIVAQAGRPSSVTIATNMAGRGTDIVLGGNFDVLARNELLKNGENPDDFTQEQLRERFSGMYKKLQEDHEKVVQAGGLHIIGTERHESRRIDNQLRGRAGRQGDPGSSKFFLSLDDDLMRIFGSERIASIMDRLGAEDGEVISHPLVNRAIGNAQRRVEGRNYEIRKHLKEYDDVMNLQRTEIYSLRARVLKGEDIKNEILEQIESTVEELVFKYTAEGKYPETWNLKGLYEDVQAMFGVTYKVADEELSGKTQKILFDEVMNRVQMRYDEKEQRFGSEMMRQFERGVFLMVIDNLWKDHLYEMDHLKGGVQYSAYGQKNPLYEYQREGLQLFQQLRSTIAKEVTSFIFRLEGVERRDRMGTDRSKTVHSEFDVFSSGGAPQAQPRKQLVTNRAGGDGKKPVPVRVEQRAGRNDPCPCGSGKKYKKCCGA
jgi:preprotein translocase subunit SecA